MKITQLKYLEYLNFHLLRILKYYERKKINKPTFFPKIRPTFSFSNILSKVKIFSLKSKNYLLFNKINYKLKNNKVTK